MLLLVDLRQICPSARIAGLRWGSILLLRRLGLAVPGRDVSRAARSGRTSWVSHAVACADTALEVEGDDGPLRTVLFPCHATFSSQIKNKSVASPTTATNPAKNSIAISSISIAIPVLENSTDIGAKARTIRYTIPMRDRSNAPANAPTPLSATVELKSRSR